MSPFTALLVTTIDSSSCGDFGASSYRDLWCPVWGVGFPKKSGPFIKGKQEEYSDV